ncbi:hypothetical protein [Candidatus Odyssella thessalonicensis]|nr:hypothetical protein [Candidatus Odyssella thessalonicensis]
MISIKAREAEEAERRRQQQWWTLYGLKHTVSNWWHSTPSPAV